MQSSSSTSFMRRLVQIQTAALVLVFAGILFNGYHGRTWSEVQSFQVADNWCQVGSQGVGQHCFGDFGLPYYRGLGASPYEANNFAAANTPLTAVIFEVLRLLPYNFALLLYLLGIVSAVALPFFSRRSRLTFGEKTQLAVLCGLITTGGISAFDRGNHVAFFVPLLVWFLLAVQQERWRHAVFFLTIMAMLKFWGIVFVVVLLARSKWVHAIASAIMTGVLSAILLIPFPGSFSLSVKSMTSMAGNRDYANAISGYAISIHGLVRRSFCALSSEEWCNTKSQANSMVASPFIGLAIAVSLCVIAYLLTRSVTVPHQIWIACIVSLGFLAVPEAPVYNLVLLAAVPAVMSRLIDSRTLPGWRASHVALTAAFVVSFTPFTLFSTQHSRFATGTSDSLIFFRSDYWMIPSVWIIFLLVASRDYLRNRAFKHHQE